MKIIRSLGICSIQCTRSFLLHIRSIVKMSHCTKPAYPQRDLTSTIGDRSISSASISSPFSLALVDSVPPIVSRRCRPDRKPANQRFVSTQNSTRRIVSGSRVIISGILARFTYSRLFLNAYCVKRGPFRAFLTDFFCVSSVSL